VNLKIWNVVLFTGIVVGLVGCFLPWGIHNQWPEDMRVGTWIFPGIFLFLSLIVAAVFQLLFLVSGKWYMILAVLLIALGGFGFLVNWLGEPVANEYGMGGFYAVLCGAYVSLLGIVDVVISAATFLYFTVMKEKQGLPNNKSSP
jgi:hypothetical protein